MRRLPAEWEPQEAVLLTWPHRDTDWRPRLADVEAAYARIAREISLREPVIVVCADQDHRARVARLLREAAAEWDRICLFSCPSNDTWTRDYGPLTVLDGIKRTLVDFAFDGWGGKYPAGLDDRVTRCLHAAGAFGEVRLERLETVFEGGSIETDGRGTILTTRHCLEKRLQPGQSLTDLEAILRHALGATRFLWLQHGVLQGDDTDGHVDTLARFCDTATIAHMACADPRDPNYDALQAMAAELRDLQSADGRPYRLVALPCPAPKRDEAGEPLPATYANFLIINGAVLVPVYDDAADAEALARVADCFPGRDVVAIPCLPLVWQHGSLHCVTMHLPDPPATP